ncbi:hypothetical protein GMMP15_20016 [Candidatus Magnetomoraceae bacterium gMMP-15]
MKKHLIITCYMIFFLLFISIENGLCCDSQTIYTKDCTDSFSFKWISTDTGKQEVEQLFPDEAKAKNPEGSDVIKWTWNKEESGWAGWGMQWLGWDKPINLFKIIGLDIKDDKKISSKIARTFSKEAAKFALQFKVKGFISSDKHKELLWVRFDGKGDVPSKEIPFLSYIIGNKPLSKTEFRKVSIPLNRFRIVRSRIDASEIKQIVFGTPTISNTNGTLYIYDIRITKIK